MQPLEDTSLSKVAPTKRLRGSKAWPALGAPPRCLERLAGAQQIDLRFMSEKMKEDDPCVRGSYIGSWRPQVVTSDNVGINIRPMRMRAMYIQVLKTPPLAVIRYS